MSRARGRTVGALEPFPLASDLTCDCKPGSATALFGSVRSRRSLARTSGQICIAYCSFVGPATESANVVLSGEPFVSERLFLSKAGANPQKGDRSRIARRFLLSSVRKRKIRRRLGPAAGSRPQSVCWGSGCGIARERDFAGTLSVVSLCFRTGCGKRRAAEENCGVRYSHPVPSSVGEGALRGWPGRSGGLPKRVRAGPGAKNEAAENSAASAVARRYGYFLEERYSFTTL